MATRREQVLAAINAAVVPTAGVSGRVYRSRVEPLARQESPAIVIEPLNDSADQNTSLPTLDWSLTVRVAVIVRGIVPDQLADPIICDMHSRIMADLTLGTVDAFGLKNTSGGTKLLRFFGSIDARTVTGNNQTLGVKMAYNGVAINETECRAFTGTGTEEAKLVTSWMIELGNGDEVSLFIANHSGSGNISFRRGRIIASEVR